MCPEHQEYNLMNCEGNPVMLSWTTLSMDIFILPSSVISINYFSRLADVFSSSADGNKAAVAQASVKFFTRTQCLFLVAKA